MPKKNILTITEKNKQEYSTIRFINDGGNHVVDVDVALKAAVESEKQLIVFDNTQEPPVCKLDDLGKLKFKKKKKNAKNNSKSQKKQKEVVIKHRCEERDFQRYLNKIRQLIQKGHKVDVKIRRVKGPGGTRTSKADFQAIAAQRLMDVEDNLKESAKSQGYIDKDNLQMVMLTFVPIRTQ